MKKKSQISLLLFYLLQTWSTAYSQVNGTPDPCVDGSQNTCKCDDAPILCTINDLDGYTYSMTNFQHPADAPSPLCPGAFSQPDNPSWFGFFAWCEELTLQVNFSNCSDEGGFSQGIQLAVYEDCSLNPNSAVACDVGIFGGNCNQENGDRIVTVSGMVTGSIYYVMVDGCGGSACDILIDVIGDCGIDDIAPWDQEIQGPAFICVNESVTYSLDYPQVGAINYTWFIDGSIIGSGDNLLSISNSFSAQGNYIICVDVDNDPCIEIDSDPSPLCKPVTVTEVEANAGNIMASPLIACPGEDIEIEIQNYTQSPNFNQWIIIVNDVNTIIVAELGNNAVINEEECLVFKVYSYNHFSSGGFPTPVLGEYFNLQDDCSFDCFCDLVELEISWVDSELPVFAPIEDITVDCYVEFESLSTELVWTDNCDGTDTAISSDIGTVTFCQGGSITRVWEYTDYCGNLATQTQEIFLEPLAKTVWQHDLEDTVIINCNGMLPAMTTLPFTNNLEGICQNSDSVLGEDSGSLDECGDVVIRTWNYNPSICQPNIVYNQYFILSDTVAPVFDTILVDTVLSCFSQFAELSLELEWQDNCDGVGVALSIDSDTLTGCTGGSIIRTWSYQDVCGNIGSVSQNISIASSIQFELLDSLPAVEQFIQCGDTVPSLDTLRYTNNSSDAFCLLEGSIVGVESGVLESCGDTLFRSWTLAEPICDSIISYNQILILIDTLPALFLDVPMDTLIVACRADIPIIVDLSWEDNCDGTGLASPIEIDTIDGCLGGKIFRTWEYADSCGNMTAVFNQVIIVEAPLVSVCDDEDPCTSGDVQVITCDGTICQPCMGTFDPTLDPIIEGGLTICATDSTILSVNNCSGIVSWYADIDRIDLLATGNLYNTGGLISNNSLFVECNNNGCLSNLIEVTINVNTIVAPTITGDNIICPGDSTQLDAGLGYSNYSWSTGEVSETITVSDPGDYTVSVMSADGCIDSASFILTLIEELPFISIIGSSSYCVGGFTELTANAAGGTIEWSTGSETATITVMNEGEVSVTVTDANGCTGSSSVMVTEQAFLMPMIGGDVVFCEGFSTQLDAGVFQTWMWSTGENDQIITIDSETTVSVTVTDFSGCTGESTVQTTISPNPNPIIIPEEPMICTGGQTQLEVSENYDLIIWSTAEITQSIEVDQSVLYFVTVTDEYGCIGSSQVSVQHLPAPKLCDQEYTCNLLQNTYDLTLNTTADLAINLYYNLTFDGSMLVVDSVPLDSMVSIQLVDLVTGCDTTVIISPPNCNCTAVSDAGSSQEITCVDNAVTLGTTITSSGSDYSYSWIDELGNEVGTNATYDAELPGIYTLEVFDLANMCSVESQVEVVDGKDKPIAVILADPSNIIDCVVDVITLSAQEEENVSYSWQFNKLISEENQIVVDASGEAFLFAVDTLSGCTDTTSLVIEDQGAYPLIFIAESLSLTCDIVTVIIDATSSQSGQDITHQWYDETDELTGQTTLSLSVTEPGEYYLESIDISNNCVNIDTILITEVKEYPVIDLENELILACDGSNKQILANILSEGNVLINWLTTDGEIEGVTTSDMIEVDSSGLYLIEVIDEDTGCKTLDSISVTLAGSPTDIVEQVVQPNCENDLNGSILISEVIGGTPPYSFAVNGQPGLITLDIPSNFGEGDFIVEITDSLGCTMERPFALQALELPTLTIEEPMVEVDFDESIIVNLITNVDDQDIVAIIWMPELESSCANCIQVDINSIQESQKYTISLEDINGCIAITELEILVKVKEEDIFIPNIINATEENFYPQSGTEVVMVDMMQVFDRWGNVIFEDSNFLTNDPNQGWNGTYNDRRIESGVYVYVFTFDFPSVGKIIKTGDITVIY